MTMLWINRLWWVALIVMGFIAGLQVNWWVIAILVLVGVRAWYRDLKEEIIEVTQTPYTIPSDLGDYLEQQKSNRRTMWG